MKNHGNRPRAVNMTITSYLATLAAALLAGSGVVSSAQAAEPEAQLGWGLEFGGSSTAVQPMYRLGLAAGGLPLFQRTYRASATEAAAEEQAAVQSSSDGSWVPWVVGGVVAVVAIGVSFADERSEGCVACIDDQRSSNQISGAEDDGVACANGTCVTCADGSIASDCDGLIARPMRGESEIDVERQRWLDAGTGHMGDLRR